MRLQKRRCIGKEVTDLGHRTDSMALRSDLLSQHLSTSQPG